MLHIVHFVLLFLPPSFPYRNFHILRRLLHYKSCSKIETLIKQKSAVPVNNACVYRRLFLQLNAFLLRVVLLHVCHFFPLSAPKPIKKKKIQHSCTCCWIHCWFPGGSEVLFAFLRSRNLLTFSLSHSQTVLMFMKPEEIAQKCTCLQ